MPRPRENLGKRKVVPVRRSSASEDEATPPLRHMRLPGERRSKVREDVRYGAESRGKAPARLSPPPAKKKKVVVEVSEDEEQEEDELAADEGEENTGLKEQSWSRGYDTGSGDKNSDGSTDDAIEALSAQPERKSVSSSAMKKPVELDLQGEPFGSMKDAFTKDVNKYAKELDPRMGWEGQPRRLRRRLFKRIYADWQMIGDSERVSGKFLQPIITKSLITVRWKINQVIDAHLPRPEDVKPHYWKGLVAMRSTEAAQQKSAHMRSISKGKGSTTAQMKGIEREVVSRLTMLKNRPPSDKEVDEEVAKEYQRISEEKRKVRRDYGKDIEEVRTRVTELEGSVTRLGDNMTAPQKRLEDMVASLLHSQGVQFPTAIQGTTEPLPSRKVLEMSPLTSNTTAAWTAVQKDFLLPMLKSSVPVDVTPTSPNAVHRNIMEDVVADVGTDKEVAANGVTDDGVAVAVQQQSKSAEVTADGEEVRGEEEEGDVYSILNEAATQAPSEGVVAQRESVTPPQEDVQAPAKSSGRPRRATKTAQAGKAMSKTTVPRASMPKTVASGKKPEALWKK